MTMTHITMASFNIRHHHLGYGKYPLGVRGPDGAVSIVVENEVPTILDDAVNVAPFSPCAGAPDFHVIVGTRHDIVSAQEVPIIQLLSHSASSERNSNVKGVPKNLLHDEVSVLLHMDTLNVVALFASDLPNTSAVMVHVDLAVLLHREPAPVILTFDVLARPEPLAVLENVWHVV